ncbi:MAG: single-stranded DNA-binding protein [Bacilli bacterium]|nr:single-stranded DNA-binding protein [Bacilli bacterium]
MLNQIVLVGRIVANPEIEKSEEGKGRSQITLAVPRSYKNADGEYDTDFVDCVLWGGIAENVTEYCKKGDLVGIKGRVQTNTYENKDGEKKKNMQVVAEKVTFLSSSKNKENETEKSNEDNYEIEL